MKNALILYDGNASEDPRVRNIVAAMRNWFQLTISAYEPTSDADIEFIKLLPPSSRPWHWDLPTLLRKFISGGVRAKASVQRLSPQLFFRSQAEDRLLRLRFERLKSCTPDLVVCVHPWLVPLGLRLRDYNRCPLVCDLYEYYPRQFDNDREWMRTVGSRYDYLCKRYLPKVDLCLVAAAGFEEEYRRKYGVRSVYFPCVTPYTDLRPTPTDATRIRMIHHGIANPSRNIEVMIRVAETLRDPFTLDLMMVPSESHRRYHMRLLDAAAKVRNVNIRPPVLLSEIVQTLSGFDIGLYIMPPTNFNQSISTPNKLFEFIQARLAVAIGPSKGMVPIVTKYEVGVVAQDFSIDSMVECLRGLTPQDIAAFKNASHIAARELAAEAWYDKIGERIYGLVSCASR